MLQAEFLFESTSYSSMEAEQDNMATTGLTFIILFLISLLFTIGSVTLKVTAGFNNTIIYFKVCRQTALRIQKEAVKLQKLSVCFFAGG